MVYIDTTDDQSLFRSILETAQLVWKYQPLQIKGVLSRSINPFLKAVNAIVICGLILIFTEIDLYMKWDIQTVGFNAKQELLDSTKEKIEKLEKFYSPIIGAEVYLRLEYNDQQENKKVVIKLNIAGEDAYAEDQSNAFEKSLSVCVDKLKRQLIKRNEIERAVR